MAPVVKSLAASRTFATRVCVTAQHRQMLDQALSLFGIRPDYDLNVMKPNQSLDQIAASVLTGVGSVLDEVEPDVVLVHGDTSTGLAATLAAYHRRIHVGHVEAGLRTGDLLAPWPEEGNRRVVGALATWHFAPTLTAKANLLREGISESNVVVTGNTVIDALLSAVRRIREEPALNARLAAQFPFLRANRRQILVTGHRRENFGDGLRSVCSALERLSLREDVQIVYPVHPNPNVLNPVKERLAGISKIHLIDPVDYLPFVYLMSRASVILTDSGGVQEEAPSLGVPVLVMRDVTERPEAVEAGTAVLVGTSAERIVQGVTRALAAPTNGHIIKNPYGDGKASRRIVEFLRVRLTAEGQGVDRTAAHSPA